MHCLGLTMTTSNYLVAVQMPDGICVFFVFFFVLSPKRERCIFFTNRLPIELFEKKNKKQEAYKGLTDAYAWNW